MRQSSAGEIGSYSSSWLSTQWLHYLETGSKTLAKAQGRRVIDISGTTETARKNIEGKKGSRRFLYAYLRIEFQCHNVLVKPRASWFY